MTTNLNGIVLEQIDINIKNIVNKQEGRRLEFKAQMPENSDLVKTIVTFANDAGGDIFIGISYRHREIVWIEEDKLTIS